MQRMTPEERRARVEHIRRSRQTMLRWRWVVVGLGGLLAAALLANGNFVIGGLLAALLVARVVMIVRVQQLWKERDAAFTRRFGTGSADRSTGEIDGRTGLA